MGGGNFRVQGYFEGIIERANGVRVLPECVRGTRIGCAAAEILVQAACARIIDTFVIGGTGCFNDDVGAIRCNATCAI